MDSGQSCESLLVSTIRRLDNRVGCAERTRSGFCLRDFHKRNRASRSGRAGAAELHAPAARVKYRGAMDGGGEKISAVQSGGFDRLDNGRIIVTDAGAIEPRRYGPFAQAPILPAQLERVGAERTVKPGVEILRLAAAPACGRDTAAIQALAPHTMIVQDRISSPRRGIAPAVPQRRRRRARASRRPR